MSWELESYHNNFVTASEQKPASTTNILARFGFKPEPPSQAALPAFCVAVVKDFLAGEGGSSFDANNKECPYKSLVMAGSLLVGLTDPDQVKRVNDIFCGQTIKYEDSEGPLSGRKGEVYKPLSHCWRTTVELVRLTRFMKINEEMPPLTSEPNMDEEKFKNLLVTRSEVKKRNEQRQAVFSVWTQIRDSLAHPSQSQAQLPESSDISNSFAITKQTFDASSQLDVGGPEYQALISWVEEMVLKPLVNLVGEGNTRNYLIKDTDSIIINLAFQKTARNCPNRHHEEFFGEMF